jgi:hypothetical protein
VCTEAEAVVRAVVEDFFLDRWHVEIASVNTVHMRTDTLIDSYAAPPTVEEADPRK